MANSGKPLLIIGSSLIIIFIVLGIVWGKISNAPIKYTPPKRPDCPKPNAFDTFTKAADSIVCKQQVNEAVSANLPSNTQQPSGVPLEQPGESQTLPAGVPVAGSLNRFYNLQEKQAVLDANAKALSIYHEGLRQHCMMPYSYKTELYPEYAKMRQLARLLSLEIDVCAEKKQYDKAIDNSIDGLEFSNNIANEGNLIAGLVSIALQTIIRSNAWNTVDGLSLGESKAAVNRLQGLNAHLLSFKSIMKEDKHFSLSMIYKELNSNRWRSEYMTSCHVMSQQPLVLGKFPDPKFVLASHRISRRALFADIIRDHDQIIHTTDLPYPQYVSNPISHSNPISGMMSPVYNRARFKFENNRCLNEFLMLQIALHAYKLEHKTYPAKLSDLSPAYIRILPTDPFTDGKPYKYSLKGSTYTLYSVGPDLRDDGGVAVTQKNRSKRYVAIEDKGDIVAGFNR